MAMNKEQEKYFTFAFNVDPELNSGYTEAFKQGNDDWWYVNDQAGAAAGPVPNFTGATFKSLHQWNKQLLS
jgi:hypothetical protein